MEIDVTLTIDAEGVYKSLSSRDLKTPAEKMLLGHVAWIREMSQKKIMTVDGRTEGSIERAGLLKVMKGEQSYAQATQTYEPVRESLLPE